MAYLLVCITSKNYVLQWLRRATILFIQITIGCTCVLTLVILVLHTALAKPCLAHLQAVLSCCFRCLVCSTGSRRRWWRCLTFRHAVCLCRRWRGWTRSLLHWK